jgi:hypothetical protein
MQVTVGADGKPTEVQLQVEGKIVAVKAAKLEFQ